MRDSALLKRAELLIVSSGYQIHPCVDSTGDSPSHCLAEVGRPATVEVPPKRDPGELARAIEPLIDPDRLPMLPLGAILTCSRLPRRRRCWTSMMSTIKWLNSWSRKKSMGSYKAPS